MFCRIIRAEDNDLYEPEFELMRKHAPEMLGRKITSSLHQSAQILKEVLKVIQSDSKVLNIGFYEDVPTKVLYELDYTILGVDPVVNYDLETYRANHPEDDGTYDIIFSTSTIEHVADDKKFITDLCALLRPGGKAFLTCDFKPGYQEGDPVPATCQRLYTADRLNLLLKVAKAHGCESLGTPTWGNIQDDDLDFEWDGVKYCFAGLGLVKNERD